MNPSIDLLRVTLSLAFVLGLLGLLNFLVRRYGDRFGLPTAPNVGRNRRVRVVEVTPIDPRTKLVLVRRDETEHLILVGAHGGTIIENNIPIPTLAPTETA